nr:selenoprotein K-like [Nomia melanderi]
MVYISNDGQVLDSTPWSLKRLFGFFSGIIYMIVMFFKTMINPNTSSYGSSHTRDFRPGSGPPYQPMRRLRPDARVNVDIPFGGCSSCGG